MSGRQLVTFFAFCHLAKFEFQFASRSWRQVTAERQPKKNHLRGPPSANARAAPAATNVVFLLVCFMCVFVFFLFFFVCCCFVFVVVVVVVVVVVF